ncbi:MAG: ATP-grasp domain-containing protein, partial [Myxococcota bacterium]
MRFYEYEAKALFRRHQLPLGKSQLVHNSDEARQAFASLGGVPVVLKSQVLSGGRMKAGAVIFANDADEAAAATEAIFPIEVNGQKCRCVLIEEKTSIAQEYFVAITWDGRAKRPVCVFSDMGGIDIEEVAVSHPEHVSKTHFSSILPLTPRIAKEAVGATGVTGGDLNKLSPIVFKLIQIFLEYDLTLAEINPLAKLEDGRFVVLDG